jgi:hypothetical protein
MVVAAACGVGRRVRSHARLGVPWCALALALAFGCKGAIERASDDLADAPGASSGEPGVGATAGSGASGASGGAGGDQAMAGTSGGASACTGVPEIGAPMPVRRLTAPQLAATVEDVLGEQAAYPLADETLLGYRANTSSALDSTSARLLLTSAEEVAQVAGPKLLADPSCMEDCASHLLDEVARRLFRRPLDAQTRERYAALYEAGVEAEGPAGGVRFLLEGLLQSPRFVYMLEASDAEGRLDGYSIASRLSYALWGGPPDAELLDAAESGELDDDAGISAAADRMIDDPRFLRGLRDFVGQWLGLEHLEHESVRPDVASSTRRRGRRWRASRSS